MVSTVVFDFDGTLVDSNAIKRLGFFDVVAAHADGEAVMADVLARVVGDRRAIFAAYARQRGNPSADDVEALVQAYSRRVDERVAAAPEMPGAEALLAKLRQHGVRVVLSSATPVDSLRRIVEQRGWLRHFDEVLGHPSRKVDSLRRLLQRGATNIAVVGDGEDDRDSAAAVGCSFFAVGEARGGLAGEPVFTLPELSAVLLDRVGAAP
jgi:phosphoglycolate phosphatase